MRYCERCGMVIDEFSFWRDEQNCPICSWTWSEDDMTALRYAELSEAEKDVYDKQLLNLIINGPNFNEDAFYGQNSEKEGRFWVEFRPEKWKALSTTLSEEQFNEQIEARKTREPFKPFPPIDTVKARQYALEKERGRMEWKEELARKEAEEAAANVPRCPTCSSTSIEKISLGKKAFGGAMFGIFSSNVRNTFHCKNCGYKW